MGKIQLISLSLFLLLACKEEKSNPDEIFGSCDDISTNIDFPTDIPGWKVELIENDLNRYRDWNTYFLNETTGFVFEPNGQCYKTIDGGDSWKQVINDGAVAPRTMYFVDEQNGFLSAQNLSGCPNNCGHKMTILRTKDGGDTWEKIVHDKSGVIWDIYFSDKLNGFGYVSVLTDNYEPRMAKTTDGGNSWEFLPKLELNSLITFQFQMIDENNGFFAGRKGKLYRTKDGCTSFDSIQTPLENLWRVEFLDKLIGFASDYDKTYKTTDGGNTWELICKRPATLLHLVDQNEILTIQSAHRCVDYDVSMLDAGFFVSQNSGLTWEQSSLTLNFEIYNYHFPLPKLGFGMYGSKLVKFTKQ